MNALGDFQLAFTAAIGRSGHRVGRTDPLEAQPGFAVYRNTTPNALIEALRGHYPVTEEIVGADGFAVLAFDYARRDPPSDPLLVRYGGRFANFLETQDWVAELPYLPDVARLERLWTEAHLAPDAKPLTLADLPAIGVQAWMDMRLALHPAARIARLATPAMTIWRAHRTEPRFEILEPEWRPEGALFTRPGHAVLDFEIDAATQALLASLRFGGSLGDAVASAARLWPDADFGSLLTRLVTRGALARPHYIERK